MSCLTWWEKRRRAGILYKKRHKQKEEDEYREDIRKEAYFLWKADGKEDGKDIYHWDLAKKRILKNKQREKKQKQRNKQKQKQKQRNKQTIFHHPVIKVFGWFLGGIICLVIIQKLLIDNNLLYIKFTQFKDLIKIVAWPILALIGIIFIKPYLSVLIRSEEFTLKIGSAKLSVKSSSGGIASIANALLNETFSKVRDLTNEQVRIYYMILRVQRYQRGYQIPKPSRKRDNDFHNNLRALREANLVHPVEGGRFKGGRYAQVQPWGFIWADYVQGGQVDIRTPKGEEWKTIAAEISKREIKDIMDEMDKKAKKLE